MKNREKNSNGNRRGNNTNGGRMTKVDGEAASVAPSGEATVTTDGTDAEQPTAGQPAPEPAPETVEEPAPETIEEGGDSEIVPAETPVEGEQPAEEAAVVDPFAELPVVQLGDYELKDLTTVQGNEPFKYENVHREATEGKLHTKKGWKHSADMIAMGRTHREFKPSSVWGTIAQIVASYGRAGVPAAVLVAAVRQKQIGNKRSKYCNSLPPIGWAEGWIDTFVSKGFGRVMEKKAPQLTAEEVATEATEVADKIAA